VRLQGQLLLEQARIGKITLTATEEEPNVVIPVNARLTPDLAEVLGCRDLIYAGGVPRAAADKIEIDGEDIDCQLHFAHANYAVSVTSKSVGNYATTIDGDGVRLKFKVKLTGYADVAADLVNKIKTDSLTVTLDPSQLALELKKAKEGGEGEDTEADDPEDKSDVVEEIADLVN